MTDFYNFCFNRNLNPKDYESIYNNYPAFYKIIIGIILNGDDYSDFIEEHSFSTPKLTYLLYMLYKYPEVTNVSSTQSNHYILYFILIETHSLETAKDIYLHINPILESLDYGLTEKLLRLLAYDAQFIYYFRLNLSTEDLISVITNSEEPPAHLAKSLYLYAEVS